MKNKVDQFSTSDPNPALRVKEDGTVLYSNKAGEFLLNEWGISVEDKLPSSIIDIVKKVISLNSPERMEVKAGKRSFLTVFHPVYEEKFVFISGFDMGDWNEFKKEIQGFETQEKVRVELAEVIDIQLIKSLMEEFYKLAQITMALVDLKGNILVGVGWQDICTQFHRTCSETCKNCIESDTELSSGVSQGKFKLYKCKNSMWDISTPIIVEGQHVGNAFLGQFFFEDEFLDYEFFRSQAKKYSFDEDKYITALEKVPRLNRKVVETGMTFVMNLANLFSQISYSNTKLRKSLLERDYLVEALRESEEKERSSLEELKVVLDAVPAAVMIAHDPMANLMTGNRLSYEWNRYPEGINMSKASHEEKRPETHKLFKDGVEIPVSEMPLRVSASGKEVYDYEFDVAYPDGMMRHVLCNAIPLRDEKGNPRGSVAAMIDITKRKQVEEALNEAYKKLQIQSEELQASNEELQAQSEKLLAQTEVLQDAYQALSKSEERYRMLFTNMTEAFFLAEIINNEEGKPFDLRYLEINPAFEIHTGIKREKVLGKSFLDVFENTDFTDKNNFFEVVLSGKSTNFEVFRPATGEYFEVYAFSPEKGKLAAIFKNITGRKQMEESLRKSEGRYRSIVETANESIILVDTEAKVTYANKRMNDMFGYSLDEILGRPMWDFISEESKDIVNLILKNGLQGVNDSLELKLIRKGSSLVWVHVNAKSIFDKAGKFVGVITMHTDITERKEAEIRLKETLDNLEKLVKERTAKLEEAYKSSMENERKLIEAQRIAQIGNWEWDIVNDEIYWSDELYHIFGIIPLKSLSFNDALSFVHPDDRDKLINFFMSVPSGNPFEIDFRTIFLSGKERTVCMRAEVTLNEDNIPVKIKGTVQDITESRKAEEKIRNLANIVESSSNAIGTISLEGIITSWNKGAEQIYGYSAEEVSGKSVSIVAPHNLKDETKKRSELIKQGVSVHQFETIRIRKDGKKINVSINLSPVLDSYGKLTSISVISTDINERKAVEEKLLESEEKYRNIVETANEGIAVTDKAVTLIYVNKKMIDMLGYTLEEVIGKPIWDFISEGSKEIVKKNLENRILGIEENYEANLLHKDGSTVWVHINAKCLYDENGEFNGTLAMLADITKRKEAEQILVKIEITRKQEIHHRIKNNLQVISSLLDLQAEKFNNREDIKDSEVLEAFRESQDRVISMALIHEELYKGGGLDTLEFSSYAEVLAKNLFQTYRLGDTDISLNLDLEKKIFFDMDTAVPLGIIVNELVSNSFKHAFPNGNKGEITIILRRENNGEHMKSIIDDYKITSFTLIVSDNGVGLPENLDIEDLDSLGLQLVTSLVDQLDGELEFKRDNGAAFIIRFTVKEKVNKESTFQLKLVDNE